MKRIRLTDIVDDTTQEKHAKVVFRKAMDCKGLVLGYVPAASNLEWKEETRRYFIGTVFICYVEKRNDKPKPFMCYLYTGTLNKGTEFDTEAAMHEFIAGELRKESP
jgi:hypothetical protein